MPCRVSPGVFALMQAGSFAPPRESSRELVAVYAVSRTLGLAREIGVAVVFGTTVAADRLSAGLVVASLAALIVGELMFATHVRRADAGLPFGSVAWNSTAARAVMIAMAYVLPGSLITLAILPSESLENALVITACLAASVGCAGAAGLPNAVLTLNARVARVNLAQACWSVGALFGLLAEHEFGGGVAVVAAGWSGGTACGLLLATWWARRLLPPGQARSRSALDLRFAGPVALAFGLISVQGIVDRGIASRLGEGAVAALSYADRLFLLPVGFVTSALAPAMLAVVIAHRNEGGGGEGAAVVRTSRRLVALALPASFLLLAACPLVVDVVLGYGAFDTRSADLTVAALDGLAVGIAATSLALILYRTMQAALPLGKLVRVALASLLASGVVSVALAIPLGLRGVTLGTTVAAGLTIALQTWLLSSAFGSSWSAAFRRRVLMPALTWTGLAVVLCALLSELPGWRPVAVVFAVMSYLSVRPGSSCSP